MHSPAIRIVAVHTSASFPPTHGKRQDDAFHQLEHGPQMTPLQPDSSVLLPDKMIVNTPIVCCYLVKKLIIWRRSVPGGLTPGPSRQPLRAEGETDSLPEPGPENSNLQH